jgi:hypothetical protein
MLWAAKDIDLARLLEPALWLILALLVGASIIMVFRRMRDKERAVSADQPPQQLSHYRKMFEQGEISEAEYDQLYQLFTGRPRPKPAAGKAAPQTEGGNNAGCGDSPH